MKLLEHEGKEIFRRYEIDIPKGVVVSSPEMFKGLNAEEVVVKAQVLVGGRGKAGGIKFASSVVKETISSILGMSIKGEAVNEVLVEEKLPIEEELYLAVAVDRTNKCLILLYSTEGGVDIEETALNNPEKILKIPIKDGSSFASLPKDVQPIAEKLYRISKEMDAELVEINPLVKANGKLIAADAKVIIDDNALFRHPEFSKKKDYTYIEEIAASSGLQYVELKGNIAIIGNGAGLVMATLDVLDYYGGKAANFLDVGGGASVEKMEKALEVALMKNPSGIFINIFGGITRCDEIALGLVNFISSRNVQLPLVVRLIGTNEEEGKKILNENGISSLDSMEECAKKIVELTS
ncbi:MAG: ADP-forming succinate--CoA ligase subunit beta [Candidatus Woesearchaeota archaeon]